MALSKPISYSLSEKLNSLTKEETAETLHENFRRFFERRTGLLDSVVKSVNKGKYYENLVGTIVSEIDETMSCPTRAVKTILDLGIPENKYEVLTKHPLIEKNGELVQPTVAGIKIPNFYAPVKKVKKELKKLKETFDLFQVGDNAFAWSPLKCLQYIFGNEKLYKLLDDPYNLEIIIRGDGFPVGGSHASFLILTLGNFGRLGKTLGHNFLICLGEVSEKNQQEVYNTFAAVMEELNSWNRNRTLELFQGVKVNVKVEWGGDESWLRMLLGLKGAQENLPCVKCWWHRHTEYHALGRIERIISSFVGFHERGTMDGVNWPMVTEGDIWQVHQCGMHAIIPFGKDLCQFVFDFLQATGNAAKADAATKWLKKHRLNIDVTKLPTHAKWNIKATHTWEWILNWESFCDEIGMYNCPVNLLVDLLVQNFEVIYMWEFTKPYAKAMLRTFKASVGFFIDSWRKVIAPTKNRNYYHFLAIEAALQIDASGSIWKYASDVTESYVYVLKQCFLRFTNRGGLQRSWVKQAMQRCLLQTLIRLKSKDTWGSLTPYERKKLMTDAAKEMMLEELFEIETEDVEFD